MLRVASPLRGRHVLHHPGTKLLLLHDDHPVTLGNRALVPHDRELVLVRGAVLRHQGSPDVPQPRVTAANVRGLLHTDTYLFTTAKLQVRPLPFPVDRLAQTAACAIFRIATLSKATTTFVNDSSV